VPKENGVKAVNVPSFAFLLFALVGAVVFHIVPWRPWRQAVMLVVNLSFFASFAPHQPLAYIPFAAFLLLGYVGLLSHAYRPAGWAVVISILFAFFWLKKYTFIPSQLFLIHPYVTIGLSYVFFRVLHLAIDAHQGDLPSRPTLLSYLNYTLNFTCLVAGPIQRYDDYRISAEAPRPINMVSLGQSAERIICGLFKVFVVSALLVAVKQTLLDELLVSQPFDERILIAMALVGIYPLYLYFNFSGYTDFVIGVARWFGLVLPENFDRPFQSTNFIEFWSRWHITLSTWLKTYVFQPLMMRLIGRFPARNFEPAIVVLALFVTFFLVGAWHGQTTSFLFFGVLQGFGVAANRLFQFGMTRRMGKQRYRTLCANGLYCAVTRGLTFTWFSFTLLWFWSNWTQIHLITEKLGPEPISLAILLVLVISTFALSAWVAIAKIAKSLVWSGVPVAFSRYTRTMWSTTLLIIIVSVILLSNSPAPPIVYKNF
jgi:alginate O-acetyltransferase complex protein AlgI